MQAGASEDKVRQVERAAESPLFTDRERVALRYAEAMTITGEKVTEDLFGRIRGHFSQTEIVELTAAVALENFRSKFNVALGIEAQGFCVLGKHPASRLSGIVRRHARWARSSLFPPPAPRMPPSTANSP